MSLLDQYGWNECFKSKDDPSLQEGFQVARISEENRGRFKAIGESGEIQAEVTGKFNYEGPYREDFPVVGDWVLVQPISGETQAQIHHILPRKTTLYRTAPGTDNGKVNQILAANLNKVFIVQSLNQDFNLRLLERYLAMVYHSGAEPVILLSKTDLSSPEEYDNWDREIFRMDPQVLVIPFSSVTGEGIDRVRSAIRAGETVCFVGSSGVGKSTLINRLIGEELPPIKEVRKGDNQDLHGTTKRQMILLSQGGVVIETPAMREMALSDASGEITETFTDLVEVAERCRFTNCSHGHEPGCALQKALTEGKVDKKRLQSFIKLIRETSSVDPEVQKKDQRKKTKQHKKLFREQRKKKQADDMW